MKPILPLWASLALLLGCTGPPSGDARVQQAGSRHDLTSRVAAETIRSSNDFDEPIFLEIWAAGSPTAKRLAAAGYLRFDGRKLSLTSQGERLGVKLDYFQDDIPVYYFPVGRRELLEITGIQEAPMAASSKQVAFRYRKSPTELGRQLLESGTRLDELQARRVLEGRAFLTPGDGGWQVGVLEL